MTMTERTFIMIKPDGVARGLVGEIIQRFENRGLMPVAMKMMRIPPDLARNHYAVHADKPFFSSLIEYITSGPVVAMVWEGKNAIEASRATMGSTDSLEAVPGSIRGDFGLDVEQNLIHGSDGPETAAHEIELFFGEIGPTSSLE